MFNLRLDYPSYSEEVDVVRSTTSEQMPKVEKVMDAADIIAFKILVSGSLLPTTWWNAVKLVRSTRPVANGQKDREGLCRLSVRTPCVAISGARR
ncbi:MAG: hypothetical protein IPM83_16230 [Ignavibacteria bacterium]|nr:hypothetical protein [Ignavibacteria bacterium]